MGTENGDSVFCHLWDFILLNNIATEKEMDLVTNIIGNDERSLNKIIWSRENEHIEDLYNDKECKDSYDWTMLTNYDLKYLDCITEEEYEKREEEENEEDDEE